MSKQAKLYAMVPLTLIIEAKGVIEAMAEERIDVKVAELKRSHRLPPVWHKLQEIVDDFKFSD